MTTASAQISTLTHALDNLADVVSMGGPGPWNHHTCIEAEAVAQVLVAAGHPDMASLLLRDHAEDDDGEDIHADPYGEIPVCRNCARPLSRDSSDEAWQEPAPSSSTRCWVTGNDHEETNDG